MRRPESARTRARARPALLVERDSVTARVSFQSHHIAVAAAAAAAEAAASAAMEWNAPAMWHLGRAQRQQQQQRQPQQQPKNAKMEACAGADADVVCFFVAQADAAPSCG